MAVHIFIVATDSRPFWEKKIDHIVKFGAKRDYKVFFTKIIDKLFNNNKGLL